MPEEHELPTAQPCLEAGILKLFGDLVQAGGPILHICVCILYLYTYTLILI